MGALRVEERDPFTGTPLQWGVTLVLLALIWLVAKSLGDRVREQTQSELLSFVATAMVIAFLITAAIVLDRELDLELIVY